MDHKPWWYLVGLSKEEGEEFMTSPEFDEMCAVCSIASDFVRKAHGIKGGVNG